MEDFEFDTVKAEKAKALRNYKTIHSLKKFFRWFELCLLLLLFPWFSSRVPSAAKISGEYLRAVLVFLISQKAVFFIGNLIVIVLIMKSGIFSSSSSNSPGGKSTDLYDQFVKNNDRRNTVQSTEIEIPSPAPAPEPAIEEKTVCIEKLRSVVPVPVPQSCAEKSRAAAYRRSVSERQQDLGYSKSFRELRELKRSETDSRMISMTTVSKSFNESILPEMSNEEFRKTIDEFIAKQRHFCRQESLALVVQNP